MNLRYVNPNAPLSNASAGRDIAASLGQLVRPQIGGRNKNTRKRGGFVPSVMEGFVTSASKYITPMVLFAAYKMVNRPTTYSKKSKSSTRRRRQ